MSDIAIRVDHLSMFARYHVCTFARYHACTFQGLNVPTCQRSNDSVILSRITEPTSGRVEISS
jgi:hypothetical protein